MYESGATALSNSLVAWLSDFRMSKGVFNKFKVACQFRPHFLAPVISLLNALMDPVVNLTMGQTAENSVYQFNITREEADRFSVQSHERARDAIQNGLFEEITPLFDWQEMLLNRIRVLDLILRLKN